MRILKDNDADRLAVFPRLKFDSPGCLLIILTGGSGAGRCRVLRRDLETGAAGAHSSDDSVDVAFAGRILGGGKLNDARAFVVVVDVDVCGRRSRAHLDAARTRWLRIGQLDPKILGRFDQKIVHELDHDLLVRLTGPKGEPAGSGLEVDVRFSAIGFGRVVDREDRARVAETRRCHGERHLAVATAGRALVCGIAGGAELDGVAAVVVEDLNGCRYALRKVGVP